MSIKKPLLIRNCFNNIYRSVRTESTKTNLLIQEKQKSKPKKNYGYKIPPLKTSNAKQIRICTGAQLKRSCAPKLPPQEEYERGSAIKGLILFGIKAIIAGLVTYITWDAGVWGDQESTERIYRTICGAVTKDPIAKKTISDTNVCEAEKNLMKKSPIRPKQEKCVAPDRTREINKLRQGWNKSVNFLFNNIVGIPMYLYMCATGQNSKKEEQPKKCEKTKPKT